MREANFTALQSEDLARLFQLYDERFFTGWLSNTVVKTAATGLTFRLSTSMVRAGGKTIRTSRRLQNGTMGRHYEIAVASRMLLMNFGNYYRPLTVCGLECDDRLSALQRIMEHEMLHLAELLFWGKSSCAVPRFKTMAKNIFGHTSSKHDLITPRENAALRHGLHVGSKVIFELDGKKLAGLVNRIQQQATVLVEAPDGVRYQNGRSYQKYYIPLRRLRVMR